MSRVLSYLLLAMAITWPTLLHVGELVVGAPRTDLHNALWSLWYGAGALGGGHLPLQTEWLGHPGGGSLFVSDPLGVILVAPILGLLGIGAAHNLLIWGHITLSGWAAHGLAADVLRHGTGREPGAAPAIAGVAYASAPILLASVHNGGTESLAGGWLALAAWWTWRAAVHGGRRNTGLAAGGLVLATLGSGYGGLLAGLFLLTALVVHPTHRRALLAALAIGGCAVLPWALWVQGVAAAPDSLVGIKHVAELDAVRRSTGPADLRAYLIGGDFRSPDFRVISRYGEAFIHCTYLGWVVLLSALAALRAPAARPWAGFAGLCILLSLGPVVVVGGAPFLFGADPVRAIPLPWILAEHLPALGSLSLLWRLGQGAALGLAILAAWAWSGRGRGWIGGVIGLVLLEGLIASPVTWPVQTTPTAVSPAIHALAAAPEGAVMNAPVVGGRAYLYEQIIHKKPLVGSLNFPNNAAGRRVWAALLAGEDPEGAAKAAGIRYIVVHEDPHARKDMHDHAVARLAERQGPMAEGNSPDGSWVRVFQLW